MSALRGNKVGLRSAHAGRAGGAHRRAALLSAALALLLLGAAIRSARADAAGPVAGAAGRAVAPTLPPATVAPAPAATLAPVPSASAGTVAPPSAATAAPASAPAGRFDEDPVRRGAAAASPAVHAGTAGAGDGYDIPRVVGALATVVGLIFLLRWLARRFFALPTAQRSSRAVQVLSRSVLSPKQHLVLVRVGQRVLVAADNGSQLSPLSEITDPDEVASLLGQLQSEKDSGVFAMSSTKAFNSMLGRLKRAYGTGGADDGVLADGADDDTDLAHDRDEHAGPDAEYPGLAPAQTGPADNENIVAATRHELNGLMEKVRMVSDQFSAS